MGVVEVRTPTKSSMGGETPSRGDQGIVSVAAFELFSLFLFFSGLSFLSFFSNRFNVSLGFR